MESRIQETPTNIVHVPLGIMGIKFKFPNTWLVGGGGGEGVDLHDWRIIGGTEFSY